MHLKQIDHCSALLCYERGGRIVEIESVNTGEEPCQGHSPLCQRPIGR